MNKQQAGYIPPRTRSEMARGSGDSLAAQAWATADLCELGLRAKYPGRFEVQVHAVFNEEQAYWELATRVWTDPKNRDKFIDLPVEPHGVYPSPTLQTQIMLLVG